MFLIPSKANSIVSTLGVATEADPTPDEQTLLRDLIGARSVETHRSTASGPLWVIRLRSTDISDLSCSNRDWAGNWFRRPCESVTIIYDPSIVSYREFERDESEDAHRASRNITYLGLSDVIAISLNPTDKTERVVDTFGANVFLSREDADHKSPATMIAFERVGSSIKPEKVLDPHCHPIKTLKTDTLGSREVKSVTYGGAEPVESDC